MSMNNSVHYTLGFLTYVWVDGKKKEQNFQDLTESLMKDGLSVVKDAIGR